MANNYYLHKWINSAHRVYENYHSKHRDFMPPISERHRRHQSHKQYGLFMSDIRVSSYYDLSSHLQHHTDYHVHVHVLTCTSNKTCH